MRNTGAVLLSVGVIGLVLAGCVPSQKPKEQGPVSWKAGAAFPDGTCAPIAGLFSGGEKSAGQEVQIAGTVKSVCQGRGCWVEVSDGKGTVIAKSLEHDVLFPKDCVGKRVHILGVIRVNPAEPCADHPAGTPKDHECPQPGMLVEILGARLE